MSEKISLDSSATAAYITIGYHLMPAAYYRVPGLAQLPHEWL